MEERTASANRIVAPLTGLVKSTAYLYMGYSSRITGNLIGSYVGLIVICIIAGLLICFVSLLKRRTNIYAIIKTNIYIRLHSKNKARVVGKKNESLAPASVRMELPSGIKSRGMITGAESHRLNPTGNKSESGLGDFC